MTAHNTAPRLVSMGEVMIELSAQAPLADAALLERSYSGDALNVAVAVHRLGVPSAIVTRLGEDPFGDYLLDQFRGLGVDLRYVERGGGSTGIYVVEQGGQGAYSIWYYRRHSAASTMSPADMEQIDLDGVEMVHLNGIAQAISGSSRQATRRLAERGRAAGALVAFDLNFRPQIWDGPAAADAADEVLPLVDVALCGFDEGQMVFGTADPESTAARLLDQGPRVAAVSMAEAGAYVAWADGEIRLPTVARIVEGAQGGGDAFAGGLAVGELLGQNPATSARLATVVAGLKVERVGPLVSLPYRAEVQARAAELGWDDVVAVLDSVEATPPASQGGDS
ncbi:MAG: sugar kinase [Chloroflexota bacterium]|nr:sugar kinase [Chloroflexota bacterium]MDE2898991.1 sugar kinase [Chloroflexota bacterium]